MRISTLSGKGTEELATKLSLASQMYLSDELKDCELHTSDGKILKGHKSVLAVQSPVFKAMFTRDMEEARTGIVRVQDFHSKTMDQLLRFAYCQEVEHLDEIAHELIYAAEKYLMMELKNKCIESLVAALDPNNVLRLLEIADHVGGATNLFEKCLTVIARYTDNILVYNIKINFTSCLQQLQRSERDS